MSGAGDQYDLTHMDQPLPVEQDPAEVYDLVPDAKDQRVPYEQEEELEYEQEEELPNEQEDEGPDEQEEQPDEQEEQLDEQEALPGENDELLSEAQLYEEIQEVFAGRKNTPSSLLLKSPRHTQQIRMVNADGTVLATLSYQSEEAPRHDVMPTPPETQVPLPRTPSVSQDPEEKTREAFRRGHRSGYHQAVTHGLYAFAAGVVGYSAYRALRESR